MQAIPFNTLFVGQHLIQLDETDSTNTHLHTLLTLGVPLPEGTLVRANMQLAGRGQSGNGWESADGQNILASILLMPHWLAACQQAGLLFATALAVRDVIAFYVPAQQVCIKWPNDVYAGQRKLAGLLVENTLRGEQVERSILGIGINVNQEEFSARAPRALSIKQMAGRTILLEDVVVRLSQNVEARYLQLKQGHAKALKAEFEGHLMGLGVRQDFLLATGTVLEGTIVGVDDAGRLQLDTAKGLRVFANKEIIPLWAK